MPVRNQKVASEQIDASSRPLAVDLDGTLILTDLFEESVFSLLRRNVLFAFLLPLWLLKGKAHLKHQIAKRVEIDARLLPYHRSFLEFLRAEHGQGRTLILTTGSNEKFAREVAQHLGIFHDVVASNATVNLSGPLKSERLRRLFGSGEFDYAGNAMIDLEVWREAGQSILVNPERGVTAAAERQCSVARRFDDRDGHPLKPYLKALRLHQWLKNLLVFVPLIMAHRFAEPLLLGQAFVAFLAFSLCASSVYLLNDLLDLPDDRRHPSKRYRPFAAGTASVAYGAMLIPVLLIAAFGLALIPPIEFIEVLAIYYAFTLGYSLWFKRAALVDVLVLAGFYTVRIFAGATAVSVEASFWLLAFSMFLFLSLALVKRYTELATQQDQTLSGSSGRGYRIADLETLSQFGTASAYMAVLVLALYINSAAVRDLYAHPVVIWLLCPLLLYMVTRLWLIARRNELHEDPVVFVIRDRCSQGIAVIGAILLWLAI